MADSITIRRLMEELTWGAHLEREWRVGRFRAMFSSMMKSAKKPEIAPRELGDGSGWLHEQCDL